MKRLWRWLRRQWNWVWWNHPSEVPPWDGPCIVGEHGPEVLAISNEWAFSTPTTNGCTHPKEWVGSMPGQIGSHGAVWWWCWLCGEEVTKDRAFRWQAPGTSIRKRGANRIISRADGAPVRLVVDPDEIHWRAA